MADYIYPFDPTGVAVSNKISGERKPISPPDWNDFYFVIPDFAPFFIEGFRAVHYPSGRTLVEGQDFWFTHWFHDASHLTAKQVYGSITLLDKTLTGFVEMTYQTLGGDWVIDTATATQLLSNTQVNPRTTTWENVVQLPYAFPPIDHEWNLADLKGMEDVILALNSIQTTLQQSTDLSIADHINNLDNPHQTTKVHVGLSLVQNYAIASLAEAEAGTANNRYMTPLRVKQLTDALVLPVVSLHAGDVNNPHAVTKTQVGLGSVDNFATSSQVDAEAGVRNDLFMTPLRVKQAIDFFQTDTIGPHIADNNNPHAVNKAQVGLGNVDNYLTATQLQAEAGVATDAFMTPLRTSQAIQALVKDVVDFHINNTSNPHAVNKTQIGLGSVEDFPVASQLEAETGSANDRYMTPLRTNQAIIALVGTTVDAHADRNDNPHSVTATQVGLGLVQNYGVALQTDAEDGTSDLLYMTPLKVRQAIQAIVLNDFDTHVANIANPHQVTKAQVGLGNVGNYSVATQVEAEAGLLDAAYMTPLKTSQAIDALIRGDLNAHITDTNNPHAVTKLQVGLGSVEDFAVATQTEAEAGIANNKYMTPLRTYQAISVLAGDAVGTHATRTDNPHSVTAAQVGAYDTSTTDLLLANKLDTTGQAADSLLFAGMDPDTLATYLDNVTQFELPVHVPVLETDVSWTLVGYTLVDVAADYQALTILLAGYNPITEIEGAVGIATLTVNGTGTDKFFAVMGNAVGNEFYTRTLSRDIGPVGEPNVQTVKELWIKQTGTRNRLTVTALDKYNFFVNDVINPQTVDIEPTDLVLVSSDSFAKESDLNIINGGTF